MLRKLPKADFLLLLLIILSGPARSQQIYQAGLSMESIEPPQKLIALSLGGYAAPWEGRFSLQWIRKDRLTPVTALAGTAGHLCLLSNGRIFCARPNPSGNIPEWEQTGSAAHLKFLAGSNDHLFAIDGEGHLLMARMDPKEIQWKEKGIIHQPVAAITAKDDEFFLASPDGTFWKGRISAGNIKLQEIRSLRLNGVIDLATSPSGIYALTNDGTIYRWGIKRRNQWIKAAWKNGVTINEDIRHLAIAGGALYGADRDHVLFEGEHRSKGDLSVRALAVSNDPGTVLIIALDLVGINGSFTRRIKEEIFQQTGIPPEAVLINVSHTHFAPVTQAWPTWQDFNQQPDSNYLRLVKKKILRTAGRAIENMQPARLFFGRETTDIGFNRSLPDHPELYDSDVDVIKVEFVDSGKANYLFMAACHPVHSTSGKFHFTLSANFPGVARQLVEQRTGTSNALFLQGAAGDINPADNDEYLTGKKLAGKVLAVIHRSMNKISGPVSFSLDTIHVPLEKIPKEAVVQLKEQSLNSPGGMIAERNLIWCESVLEGYAENNIPSALPVYFQTINIGNWKLTGFSRETTSEYSLEVKKLWPDQMVSVAGFTNDVSSYLPTGKHIEMKNYEGYDSFFWYGVPGTFPASVKDTVIAFIQKKRDL